MTHDFSGHDSLTVSEPPSSPSSRDRLKRFSEAIRMEHHTLAVRPDCALQQLYDHLQWSFPRDAVLKRAFETAEQGRSRASRRWVRNELQRVAYDLMLAGHSGPIQNLVYVPREKLLITGGEDKSIRIWNLDEARCEMVIDTGEPVNKVLCHDLHSIVALTSRGTILVCDANSGKSRVAVVSPDDRVEDVALTGGQQILTAHRGGVVRIWNFGAEQCAVEIPTHFDRLRYLAIGSEGTFAVAGHNAIAVYRGDSLLAEYSVADRVFGLASSPDGQWLAAATLKNVLVFDLNAVDELRREMKVSTELDRIGGGLEDSDARNLSDRSGSGSSARPLVWGSDRRLLLLRRQPCLYDGRTGICEATVENTADWQAHSGCFIDVDSLALGRKDGQVQICAVPRTKPTCVLAANDAPTVDCFTDTSSDDVIVVSRSGKISILKRSGFRESRSIDSSAGQVTSAAFDGRNRLLVVGTEKGAIFSVDVVAINAPVLLYSHRSEVLCIRFSPDSRYLATSSRDKRIITYNLETKGIQSTLARHRRRVVSFAWHFDSRHLFSTSTDRTIRVWDAQKGSELAIARSKRILLGSISEHPQGHELVGCTPDRDVHRFAVMRIWDFIQQRTRSWNEWGTSYGNPDQVFGEIHLESLKMPAGGARTSQYCDITEYRSEHLSNGRLVYVCGSEPAVMLDVERRVVVKTFVDGDGLEAGERFSAGFSIGSNRLLRGTTKGRVFIWDISNEGLQGDSLLRGPASSFGEPACHLSAGGDTAAINWSTGAVTVVNTRLPIRPKDLALDVFPLVSAVLCTSPTEQYLVAARQGERRSMRQQLVRVDLTRNCTVRDVEDPVPEYTGGQRVPIAALTASPRDGIFAVIKEDGDCSIWKASSGKQQFALGMLGDCTVKPAISRSAFSEDGRRFTAITRDGRVGVWDLEDRSRRKFETASYRGDVRRYERVDLLWREQIPVKNAAGIWLSADGNQVVVLGQDGDAITCDLQTLKTETWATGISPVRHVSVYDDRLGSVLISGGSQHLALVNLRRGTAEVRSLECSRVGACAVVGVNPVIAAVACDSSVIRFLEWPEMVERGIYWALEEVLCLESLSVDGRCLAVDRQRNVLVLQLSPSEPAGSESLAVPARDLATIDLTNQEISRFPEIRSNESKGAGVGEKIGDRHSASVRDHTQTGSDRGGLLPGVREFGRTREVRPVSPDIEAVFRECQRLVNEGRIGKALQMVSQLPDNHGDVLEIKRSLLSQLAGLQCDYGRTRKEIPGLLRNLEANGVNRSMVEALARENGVDEGDSVEFHAFLLAVTEKAPKIRARGKSEPAKEEEPTHKKWWRFW